MSQYHPTHRAADYPEVAREISIAEHEAVLKLVEELDLENGWIQGMGAQKIYLPDFDRKRPFAAED
jgi:hypothetical protein